MHRLVSHLAVAALALGATIAPALAESGYFVIVSSTPLGSDYDEESAGWAEDCGYDVAEGRTTRGSGFTPNLYILYAGPYDSKRRANRVLADLRPCVPDAYVKWGNL